MNALMLAEVAGHVERLAARLTVGARHLCRLGCIVWCVSALVVDPRTGPHVKFQVLALRVPLPARLTDPWLLT